MPVPNWQRPPIGQPTPGLYQAPVPPAPSRSVAAPFDNTPQLGAGVVGGMGLGADPMAGRGHGFNETFTVGGRPGTLGEFLVGPMGRLASVFGPVGFATTLAQIGAARRPGSLTSNAVYGLGPSIARGIDSAFGTGRPQSLGPAPQLDLSGGPMDMGRSRGFSPGFGPGSKAASKRGGRGGGGFGAAESGKGGIGGRY